MNATITMVVAISFALIQLEASTAHVNQDTMAVFSVSVSQIFFGLYSNYYLLFRHQ